MQKRLVALVIAALAIPALAVAQKVSYDYEKSADFTASRPTRTRMGPRSARS